MKHRIILLTIISFSLFFSNSSSWFLSKVSAQTSTDYSATPPFVTAGVPPLVMMVMGRDHKLYYEAYNDASDLDGDGVLDVGYKPDAIEYYGYFDSYKYYQYSSASKRFEPKGKSSDKKAPSGDYWSGDFLNYLSMTRIDCLRKVLYGGYRSTDTSSETVLQRTYVPQDAHSWGKEYRSIAHDGYDIRDYTPLNLPKGASRHLFASTTLSENGDPLLRVLQNSVFRIWEWVAIERPVAGSQGNDGSGRRSITDNNITSATLYDLTDGGSSGNSAHNAGAGGEITITDDFNDGVLNPLWNYVDYDGFSGTNHDEVTPDGHLVIEAAGSDTWTGSDQYAAVYLNDISGNFDFKLSINSQEYTSSWAKAGIMVRNDMSTTLSKGYCMTAVTPGNGYTFQWDSNNNGYLDKSSTQSSVTAPTWIRLTKESNLFRGFYSTDGGSNWTQIHSETITNANTTQDVGIFVTSHDASSLCTTKFDQMSIKSGIMTLPDNAFDDNFSTEWISAEEPTETSPKWIQFEFDNPQEVKSYTINAGSDAPKAWILKGSNNKTDWTALDTITDGTLTPGTKSSYPIATPAIYTYYRIEITKSSNVSLPGVSIKEIELMDATESIPEYATLNDYNVRVKVCDPSIGIEQNSKRYPNSNYKPIGILQRHGESNRMYFGLITGSYTKNTSGGVLRNNIRSITSEINASTGELKYKDDSSVGGIIKTIDKLRVEGYDYSGKSYNENCGWITNGPMSEGQCRMWGNPTAEMMYEALRYFSNDKSPTEAFTYGTNSNLDDNELGLPKPAWLDPYSNGEDLDQDGVLDPGEDLNNNGKLDGYNYCAKPFMLVLSDIYPNFDSDQLPGSEFGTVATTLNGSAGLNVSSLASVISTNEPGLSKHFIGQNKDGYDGACSSKDVTSLGKIRGLCPEEPTKQGSYYSASVAYYGNISDINTSISGNQKVGTFCVGLASPLPEFEIQVGSKVITLVPFAKSVGGSGISVSKSAFQPTNTIVDFFVESLKPASGRFRINFEDVEQGADHDMDAIVEYEYQVLDSADNPVTDPKNGSKLKITLNSSYAAGGIIQHMGYIISGTNKDGTYLEVRDRDTGAGSDPDYFMDTPPGQEPGGTYNDGKALPIYAERVFVPGTGSTTTLLKNPLWYAAKWGGFEEDDNTANNLPDKQSEWDEDGDGNPDTYFYVQNPLKLEKQLNRSFAGILRRTSSGTAASVISQTRSGEGAVYQAIFMPEYKGPDGKTVSWTGSIHSMLVDSYGNMREDTNNNKKLDLVDDKIIIFNNTDIEKYTDSNGDGILDEDNDGIADYDDPSQAPDSTGDINDVKFIWKTEDWLNEISDADIKLQRSYTADTNNRYIFTFVDSDKDMLVDSGEQIDFNYTTTISDTDLTDTSKLYTYLNIFPTFTDEPSIFNGSSDVPLDNLRSNSALFKDLVKAQTKRVIEFIRGVDQPEYDSTTYNYRLPGFRSRQTDYDDDGTLETFRLGDIIYSTPTLVGKPSESYHLLYRDSSYAEFLNKFKNRRQVIYTGANDGMFHAFNGGFFDSTNNEFKLNNSSETEYPLGSELWAYIPYNLLPHLYWLTENDYPHVYYCDLKPKIFDAKILPDDTHYTDGDSDPNWGTFLVAGMRLGGGKIIADMDKTDGSTVKTDDREMKSAYFIIDITDPESAPKVIAEFSFDNMGYTTCYPAVIPMKSKQLNGTMASNDWYLVFGSGPAESDGSPGTNNSLINAQSSQEAKLFIVNLNDLTSGTPSVSTLGSNDYVDSFDSDSFISDPISVDFDLDFSADALYFGTIEYDSSTTSNWNGKLRRVVINNDLTASNWDTDNVLIDVNKPINTAPTVALDNNKRKWVFFGTGRFFVNADKEDSDQMSYYGVIDSFDDTDSNSELDTVLITDLINVTGVEVYQDKSVTGLTSLGITSWDGTGQLVDKIDNLADDNGWYMDFPSTYERNLGQATLLGDILTYTSYSPSSDICSYSGESNLYAVYYKTGTAYHKNVIGIVESTVVGQPNKILKKISLGPGLSVTPNIHLGKEAGSKAFIQTSTGDIKSFEQLNPGEIKSGTQSWQEMSD